MLNLDNIAKKSGLRDESDVSWSDDHVPLHTRGVQVEWLNDFVWAVYREWHEVMERHESQRRASVYFDHVPEPSPLPFPVGQEMTSAFLVPNVIRPMTKLLAAPLFARVPDEYRGHPDLFVSHAWNNPLVGNAFAELEALVSPYAGRGTTKYAWLDVVCYNQHRVEAIAVDMKAIVASIGRVGIPMINSVPFSRLWCLWELLCAHVSQAQVVVYEANGSVYDLGYLARCFQEEFQSVERAATTLPSDREQILNAMVSTFGSLQKADEYVRQLVNGMLSKDSDKPWNRSATKTDDR
jgi:hypothetical protein